MVPETAGLSVEDIEEVFKGPWFSAYKRSNPMGQFSAQDTGSDKDAGYVYSDPGK